MNLTSKLVCKKLSLLVVLTMLVALLLPMGNAFAKSGTITIAGSTSVAPLSEDLAIAFMEKHPGVTINVQGGGSSAGVKAADAGAADIGSASRNLRTKEQGLGLVEHKIAVDGIAIVVNKANTAVKDLSVEQVRKIFSGEITNWSAVGGSDKAIHVVSREEGSGTRGAFTGMVMEYEDAAGEDQEADLTAKAAIQPASGAVRVTVAGDANAIGYLSLGYLDGSVSTVKIGGVAPTTKNVLAGDYQISRPFLYLTKGAPTGITKDYIDWVLGAEGQKIVGEKFVTVAAAKKAEQIVFTIGSDRYQVGGRSVKMDTAPMVSEGRTFVPVRFLANALGVSDDDIDFAKGVVTISKPGVATIELTIGEKKLQVDGKTSFMDVAPMVEDGRTMLPARPVAKALGYVVGWNKATQEVTISAK